MIGLLLAAVLQFPSASSLARPVSEPLWTAATQQQTKPVTARRIVMPSGQLAATTIRNRLLIAYIGTEDAKLGYAPRVYVQPFADSTPRRRTTLH